MFKDEIKTEPKDIFNEYRKGTEFKNSIGDRGIANQAVVNERFYRGDHWHGAKFGKDRPLVRRPIIKRSMDYKISTVTSKPVTVNYTADGIPTMTEDTGTKAEIRKKMLNGVAPETDFADDEEIAVVMEAMSQYFKVTAERVKFNSICWQSVRNAVIDGTGIIWSFWDELIRTGLYADSNKKSPISGDITAETLNVEQVVFGDPNDDDIQRQPYIILAQRINVAQVRREAQMNGVSKKEINRIKPDDAYEYTVRSDDKGNIEHDNSQRVTVLTKMYKEWDNKGGYKVMCTRVCEKIVIRKPWDMLITLYPIAKMSWEPRRGNIYGDTEITYMIPNQIAINRALSAMVQATMTAGMPVTLVNGDIIRDPYTNTPGRVMKVHGSADDMASAIRMVAPPPFNAQLINSIETLANNTLSDSGANDAALGDIRPDNAQAIIQTREAALAPMQTYVNRFYAMVEDVARIWADFWLHMYGDRKLKIVDKGGIHYFPFKAERYKNLVINAKIDVGASTMYSEAVVIGTLDALLNKGAITFEQYLENMPAGILPNVTRLLQEERARNQAASEQAYIDGETSDEKILQLWAAKDPEGYRKFTQLPPEQQQAALVRMRGAMQNVGDGDTEQEAVV